MTARSIPGRRGSVPLVALAALLAAQPLAAQIAPQPARSASPPAAALATPSTAATGPWGLQRAIDYALEHTIGVRLNQLTVQSNTQVLGRAAAHG